jgi:glycosyltransferase involved in cell wall biosynthesis
MGYRILHAIRSVNPASGGPIEGIKQLTVANQRHGHHVEVVTLDAPGDPWVKECPIRCHAMGPSLLGYGYSPRFVPWLRANRHHFDAVVINGIWQYDSFGVWRALAGTPTPYFVFPHGMLDPWFKRTYPLKHLKKWLYWPWAEYRVLRDACAVLFTCEDERRLARQSFWLYKCDEFVVNYGTAAPTGNPTQQRDLFFERFPQLADKRCLLFLGRVHVKKGTDLLLRAFARVLAQLPALITKDVQLVMAGPNNHAYGREMAKLVQELGLDDRVTWTGMLTGDLKWGAFRAAEAFVLPSHQENFGIAVAEALACGVPVLISNQVNIWREIHHDQAGLVDTDDLAGTIRLLEGWLTTDRAAWHAMKTRAQSCFRQRFDIERTAESLVRVFGIHGLMPAVAETTST